MTPLTALEDLLADLSRVLGPASATCWIEPCLVA
jgi:hypothetical protein